MVSILAMNVTIAVIGGPNCGKTEFINYFLTKASHSQDKLDNKISTTNLLTNRGNCRITFVDVDTLGEIKADGVVVMFTVDSNYTSLSAAMNDKQISGKRVVVWNKYDNKFNSAVLKSLSESPDGILSLRAGTETSHFISAKSRYNIRAPINELLQRITGDSEIRLA